MPQLEFAYITSPGDTRIVSKFQTGHISPAPNTLGLIQETSNERTQRFRRTVALTLTTRTVIPLLTLITPAVTGSLLIWIGAADVSGVIAGFLVLASTTGLLMAVSLTLFVKTYKEGLKKMLRVGQIKRMLGLSESEVTMTANTKGKLQWWFCCAVLNIILK